MNWIALVDAYLAQQRQLGYKLIDEGRYLHEFAVYAQQQKDNEILTIPLVLGWANLARSGKVTAISGRFNMVRPFARYLCTQGHDYTNLPFDFVTSTQRRPPPYIYSESDMTNLMRVAGQLTPINGLRPLTIATLIGLIASTGLRPGEAVRLKAADVDFAERMIVVNNSKGWRRRLVALSPSTTDALQNYVNRRNELNPQSHTGAFFESDHCHPLKIYMADAAFRQVRDRTVLSTAPIGQRPRLYDLRHTFVTRRVLQWYKTGADIDHGIVQLSRYIGHKKVSHTYWYLTAIPELMACASTRFAELLSVEVIL